MDDPSERSKMIETVWETNQPARCASNCDALVWSDGILGTDELGLVAPDGLGLAGV